MDSSAVGDPLRIVVIGSCVTRDSVACRSADFDVVWYQARTSIVSMTSDPVVLDLDYESSRLANFEKRNVAYDLNKKWTEQILLPCDLVIFDFIDERFGLCEVNKRFFTWSTAFREVAGAGSRTMFERYISPISQEYADLVTGHLPRFCEILTTMPNLVINDARWASIREDGSRFSENEQILIDQSNRLLDLIYTALSGATKARFLDLRASDLVAKSGHRWGDAPYHYADVTEHLIAQRILDMGVR